jgi:hypothetical protein
MSRTIFISHEGSAETKARGWPARTYGESLKAQGDEVFLSSDWESLKSGEAWFTAIVNTIRRCDEFHIVVAAKTTGWTNGWMCFEFGVAVGAGKRVVVAKPEKCDDADLLTPMALECRYASFSAAEDWRKTSSPKGDRRYLAHVLFRTPEADEFRAMLRKECQLVTSSLVTEQPLHLARAKEVFGVPSGHFYALIDHALESRSPWLNYEIGVAVGRGLWPIILVSGQIIFHDIANPIASIHLVGTGDTNRVARHFRESGFLQGSDADTRFGAFFLQGHQPLNRDRRPLPGDLSDFRDRRPLPRDLSDLDRLPKGP